MLLLDDRQGSGHLVSYLTAMVGEDNVSLTRLEFGDAAWVAALSDGKYTKCGIELKSVEEIISDIAAPRFVGYQLPGMLKAYDWTWLLVQGMVRPHPKTGVLETRHGKLWKAVRLGKRPLTYRTWQFYLNTIDYKAQCRVVRTNGRMETARWLAANYQWWQDGWDSHTSHQRMYVPLTGRFIGEETNLVRKVAAQLPGIGLTRSQAVSEAFTSVHDLVTATEAQWAEIDGIGPRTVSGILRALRGENA